MTRRKKKPGEGTPEAKAPRSAERRDATESTEIPAKVRATGSTPDVGGPEIVEAEVGGEGVADVVATREQSEKPQHHDAPTVHDARTPPGSSGETTEEGKPGEREAA